MLTGLMLAALVLPQVPGRGPRVADTPPWDGGIDDAVFSPDGKTVLTYCHRFSQRYPGQLALWDAGKAQSDDGKKRAVLWWVTFPEVDVRAMAFSADGKLVLAVERG